MAEFPALMELRRSSRDRVVATLNTAYASGLISQETHLHRLAQVFESSFIYPETLVGDLPPGRKLWRARASLTRLQRRCAAWMRSLGRPYPAPGVLIALDWHCAPGELLIGRGPMSDIVLADAAVSRSHARLIARDGNWIVQDLGSTNGTLLNGRRIGRAQLLAGDRLQLGHTSVRID